MTTINERLAEMHLNHGYCAEDGTDCDAVSLLAAVEAAAAVHRPLECEPSETICVGCSHQIGTPGNVRFMPFVEYPCPTIRAITEALGAKP